MPYAPLQWHISNVKSFYIRSFTFASGCTLKKQEKRTPMNEQMKKILQQQQEYEYLKKSPSLIHLPNNLFCSSFLTTTVFPYIKSAVQKRKWQKRQNQFAKIILYFLFFYYVLCIATYCFAMSLYPLTLIE